MIFNQERKEIQVKIVYYGPAMSGKTTSIRYLFKYFGNSNKLRSIESTVGRTLFFDFGILKFQGCNWNLKFLVYSATGQDFYSSTRPATLQGVDGIIFVADAQKNRLDKNVFSWKELKKLFGAEIFNMPIIFSLNKYDLQDIQKISHIEIKDMINYNKFTKIFINETIAKKGKGILKAFKIMINFIFPNLNLVQTN